MREKALLGTRERMGDRKTERKKEKMQENSAAALVVVATILLLLSPVWGEGRGSHAGFLSNTAETFMKSLKRQGAAGTIFISKLIQLQWLLCL